MFTSSTSSASGITATVQAEVWMRPWVSVAAGFEFQFRIHAVADDAHDDFAVAAQVRRRLGHHFHLPAVAFGVAGVHAQQVAGKQGRLVTAGAGADLEEDVALVVLVLRQQHLLQLQVELAKASLGRVDLVLGKFLHLRVRQHLLRSRDISLGGLVLVVDGDQRSELGMLAAHLAEAVHVRGGAFGHQELVQFDEAVGQLVQLEKHGWFHGVSVREIGTAANGTGMRVRPREWKPAAKRKKR
jgi:hypothetical protein